MGAINDIAEQYVAQVAELHPVLATAVGIAGHDDQMTDLSLAGFAARADLDRATIAALTKAEAGTSREQVAKAAMLERLGLAIEQYDAGETTSELNVIASWIQEVRQIFDLMPVEGEQAQRNIAARMSAVPGVYADLQRTYADAARQGRWPPGARSPSAPGSAGSGQRRARVSTMAWLAAPVHRARCLPT